MPSSTRGVVLAALLAAPLFAAGCELAEVTTPEGADVLVAESVLRTDRDPQRLLLHRTLQGRTVAGETGARVVVRAADGRSFTFQQVPQGVCLELDAQSLRGDDSLRVEATCYASVSPRWVAPGQEYELEVVTRGGERLRGRTVVPGVFDLLNLPRADRDPTTGYRRCTLPPNTPLNLVWSTSSGAWAYLTEMEVRGLKRALEGSGIPDIPDPLQLLGVSISQADTTVAVPSEIGVFDRFTQEQELLRAIQNGFPPQVQVRLVVGAGDRNFINSVRGGAFNPSGTVRISSVVGDGVGVFGSITARTLDVDVRTGAAANSCRGR
ncbi:MAG TPA: hypothetical protein VF263_17110 [Longimicrobiaceae bacterium]